MSGVSIAGVGYSTISRKGARPLAQLAVDACIAALGDAGINARDVDGVCTYNGPSEWAKTSGTEGVDQISIRTLNELLGLPMLKWYTEHQWGPPAVSCIQSAAHALITGACRIAIVYRAMRAPRGRRLGEWNAPTAEGEMQFIAPYGAAWTPAMYATQIRMYMAEYGVSREQIGRLAVLSRHNASLNEHAVLREEISLEDYLRSPMIADPLCRLDCDIPVDGAVALVLTTDDVAENLRHHPVKLVRTLVATRPPRWQAPSDSEGYGIPGFGETFWRGCRVGPQDVSVALLYDGFLPSVLLWLEVLGFCAPGRAVDLIDNGELELGGRLPVNTHGGSVAGGRLHGMSHVAEAVTQLRGHCGRRQVSDASVAVVTVGQALQPIYGPGGVAGAMVLTK